MLDKGIFYGKEKRKPYNKSKAFDRSCRNHGSCEWCESNRKYSDKKRRTAADEHFNEFNTYEEDDSGC